MSESDAPYLLLGSLLKGFLVLIERLANGRKLVFQHVLADGANVGVIQSLVEDQRCDASPIRA